MVSGNEILIALLAGVIQGVFEWLPISSEGNVAALLTAIGESPGVAVRFSLFLHVGTALAATIYYRDDLREILAEMPEWRPHRAFVDSAADLSFLALATIISGGVALIAYAALESLVSAVTGGVFVALIGVLLVATGVFQRLSSARQSDGSTGQPEREPGPIDAILVGVLQGLAILPGISRSGTTVGALLLRGYAAPTAFQLSFVLSIPASIGAGVLVLLDTNASLEIGAQAAIIALLTSAVVGYLAIDVLMHVVERISFAKICIGLGGLAILGGLLLI